MDWNEATEKVKAIQREWKNTGPVPRDISDALWERFAPSIPFLFARGIELAERATGHDPEGNR